MIALLVRPLIVLPLFALLVIVVTCSLVVDLLATRAGRGEQRAGLRMRPATRFSVI